MSYFGRQKHPTFNTYIQRKGIEIRAAEGSNIRSVLAGQVVYADWLKGYGLVIIVDHANGVFSLYAHASKILTSVGSKIEAGEAIGETGDTGMTGENTLYFELRRGGRTGGSPGVAFKTVGLGRKEPTLWNSGEADGGYISC